MVEFSHSSPVLTAVAPSNESPPPAAAGCAYIEGAAGTCAAGLADDGRYFEARSASESGLASITEMSP